MIIRSQIFTQGVALLLLITLAPASHPGDANTLNSGATIEVPSGIHISIANNRMTASIKRVPLELVFAKLAKLINLRVYSNASLIEKVSASMTGIPVQQGLHQILKGLNFAIEYSHIGRGYPRAVQPGVYMVYVFPETASEHVIPPLLQLASEESPLQSIPQDAQAAGFQSEAWEALNHSDPEIRLAAIETIAQRSTDDAPGLIYPLIRDQSAQVREAAIIGISQLVGSDSIRYLEQLVSDPSTRVRVTSYELAEDLGNDESVPILAAGLHDPDHSIQQQSIEALAAVGNRNAVAALHDAWHRGETSIRKSILLALPDLPGAESLKLLAIALDDRDRQIRRQAVYAASELDNPGVVPLVYEALEDEDSGVREAAHEAVEEYSR